MPTLSSFMNRFCSRLTSSRVTAGNGLASLQGRSSSSSRAAEGNCRRKVGRHDAQLESETMLSSNSEPVACRLRASYSAALFGSVTVDDGEPYPGTDMVTRGRVRGEAHTVDVTR